MTELIVVIMCGGNGSRLFLYLERLFQNNF